MKRSGERLRAYSVDRNGNEDRSRKKSRSFWRDLVLSTWANHDLVVSTDRIQGEAEVTYVSN